MDSLPPKNLNINLPLLYTIYISVIPMIMAKKLLFTKESTTSTTDDPASKVLFVVVLSNTVVLESSFLKLIGLQSIYISSAGALVKGFV